MSTIFSYHEDFIPESICMKHRNEGDIVIVLSANGAIEFLNETASFFFQQSDGKKSIGDIFRLMLATYDVSAEHLQNDLLELVKSLQWQRIIRLN